MKLSKLIVSQFSVPFYTLKEGTMFELIVDNEYDIIERRSDKIYETKPILMKTDMVGAKDWPYNQTGLEHTIYINEKTLVQVIKKSNREFKNYVFSRKIFK